MLNSLFNSAPTEAAAFELGKAYLDQARQYKKPQELHLARHLFTQAKEEYLKRPV